jgi:hypothetical protein
MTPETYIVRIYRRSSGRARQIAGLVETPDGALSASFASLAELADILEAPKTRLHRSEPAESPDPSGTKLYRQKNARG